MLGINHILKEGRRKEISLLHIDEKEEM